MMNSVLEKINKQIYEYEIEHKSRPNAVLLNEEDLDFLKLTVSPLSLSFGKEFEQKDLSKYTCYGLKIIPIKHGKTQVVETIE